MDLIKSLSKTDLSSNNTKELFNQIVYNAFHNATSSDEEKLIVAIALKYELECFDEIFNILEDECFNLPF